MDFPLFQVPYLGNGMTIGLNAVLHVLLSHGIAIGAMFFIALAELKGYRSQDQDWENFAKLLIKPTIIIITAVGALTGVGIWFITTALAPRAIGSMLRIFFWPWFIEWMVFTAEVIVILIYYFTWDSWREGKRKKMHIALGLSYPVLAFWSAFLITGILGFMLTSDGWPWDRSFWSAFFNPTFLPQLILRLSAGVFLGSLYVFAFLLITRLNNSFRMSALRFYGRITLVALGIGCIAVWWYFRIVPSAFLTFGKFSVLTGRFSQYSTYFGFVNLAAGILLLLYAISALIGNKNLTKILILPAAIVSILFVAEYERIREFIRGPYLLPGYMYVSQRLLTEVPTMSQRGAFYADFWNRSTGQKRTILSDGAYLFGQNCAQCHTIGGLNDIQQRLQGRTKDAMNVIVQNAHRLVPFMPPFAGTGADRLLIVEFLNSLVNEKGVIQKPYFYTGIRVGNQQ
jgi:mono/diheme cytochrome c family protein